MASWLKRRNAGTPTHSPGTARCAVELRAEGNAWLDKGDLATAEACYRQAVAVDATDPLARINLAFVLNEQKRPAEARLHAVQATVLDADSVDAFFVLANAQVEEADWPAATASLRRILQLKPDFEPAYGMLCRVLAEQGLLDDARAAIVQALTLNDRSAEFHFLLGNVEMGAGNREEAAASYRRAIALQPGIARFHSNLGMALQGHEALACYHEALRLDPGLAGAHGNFGIALYEQGDISAAVSSIRRAIALETDRVGFRSNLLFVSSLDEVCEPAQYRAEAEAYGELATRLATPFSDWPVARARSEDMPLRVGLVSGDLRSHPVGHFLEAVIAHLTTRHIELVAYPTVAQGDDLTARIRAHFAQWHSLVGLADALAAETIRTDGIQVLIDLAGHTEFNRLPVFAWRPAPVQATWLGYLATTGVTAIDYVIADAWTLPEALEPQFTERVWRLPDTYLCFTPPAQDVAVGPLPARDTGYVTFGSFNNLSKMNDAVVALWARVLAAVPHSRLFLKAQQLKDPAARQRVAARFARHGIAAERLLLEGPVPRAQYLLPFQRVDIALDPFPYPGITTSVENLWMGVPVLTLAGTTFLSRQGVGLLMNAGLPEWIAHDADDYLARAVSHASDLHTLAALRTRLRQQVLASPIFDAPRFARHFSTALRTMWQHWREHRDHASR